MDSAEPRYFCQTCKLVEYCDKHLRAEFPPAATLRAFMKKHQKSGCDGKPTYRAGVIISLRKKQ